MAPDFPINRYRTWRRLKTSRISSACRYSNAAISQPVRQVSFAPQTILFHRVEGTVRLVVQHRLMRVDKCVAQTLFERSLCGGFKLFQPFARNFRLRYPVLAFGNHSSLLSPDWRA